MAQKYKFTKNEQRIHKQKLIRRTILLCLSIIPLFIWVQSYLVRSTDGSNASDNVLIFALINANVLLVLFVLFLVLRNLAELLFERRINKLGRSLKAKLIASFLSLTLIPTILLFFVALQFVSTSMDYWFNSNIENSLEESLKLAQTAYQNRKEQVSNTGITLEKLLQTKEYDTTTLKKSLELATSLGKEKDAQEIILTFPDKNLSIQSTSHNFFPLENIPKELQENQTSVYESNLGDIISHARKFTMLFQHKQLEAILITATLLPKAELRKMESISEGIERYRQLKYFKEPFKFWLLIILLIVTLLIIFAAIWFGIYIAKGITEPLEKIVEATKKVADGDLLYQMKNSSNDEMGLLIDSFNSMTRNLYHSNDQLEKTYEVLMETSQDSEQQRRYTETILQNVSAGVISLTEQGKIKTINHFAEKLLCIQKDYFINLSFFEVLPKEQAKVITGYIDELRETGKYSLQTHLKIQVFGKNYSLLINFTRLEDELGESLGFVLFFDDLTKIEKMQRMAAWREVARRIAHEIKNPLTPIQLSAQRLRRRYPTILAEEDGVFDRCTSTIISQVDELKNLVSEFSQFARMPKIQKSKADIVALVEKTLVLYREAHKNIHFSCSCLTPLPTFFFDPEQIGRCLINLLDNAVAVLPKQGTISIDITYSQATETVHIAVADDGPGISKENKEKLFEPYFSTKKTGTGLGLSIVSAITADHNGYIRVQNNNPRGSIFTIELPLQTKDEISK